MRPKKKHVLPVTLAVIMVLSVSGCLSPGPITGNQSCEDNDTSRLIMINDGMELSREVCEIRNVDHVTVFHSPGCPACSIAVPRLEELEQEMGRNFTFIDVSDGRERLMEMGLIPAKIPTVIIDCKVYVGAKTKDDYRSLIEG